MLKTCIIIEEMKILHDVLGKIQECIGLQIIDRFLDFHINRTD